jgi:hypothetical protein
MRRAARLLVLLAVCLLVFFITLEVYRPGPSTEQVDSTVLLERIRPVLKLVTVEGDLSELYDHSDAWTYNQLLAGIPSFRKRTIVRVKARVSVGYDLNGMQEGLFNHFSPQELTALGAKAKQRVLEQVPRSGLFDEAEKQRDAIVQVVRTLVESAGWRLELGWEPKDGRTRLKG